MKYRKIKLTKKELKKAVKYLYQALDWVEGSLVTLDYKLENLNIRGQRIGALLTKKRQRPPLGQRHQPSQKNARR